MAASVLLALAGPRLAVRATRRTVLVALCLLATLRFLALTPSNERDWHPAQSVTAWAEVVGDTVTLHHVRNSEYRTEQDYDLRLETRRVRLSKLHCIDMFLCYWGSEWLAHPIMSFQFEDSPPICFSIETRRERSESYSTFAGLFRQYELYYAVGDERDFVRLRTDVREGEDAYLFRLAVEPERAQRIFLDYLKALNALHREPRFYNVLTNNCTTNIRAHVVATDERPRPWDWRILLPGKLDELIAMRSGFASPLPLGQLKRRGHVDPISARIGNPADFSRRIRAGMPGFDGR